MFANSKIGTDDDIAILGDLIIISEGTKVDGGATKEEILDKLKAIYVDKPELFKNDNKNKVINIGDVL
jgi:hypothetical protein